MQRNTMILLIATLLIPAAVSLADQPAPADHSTVHIVFIAPLANQIKQVPGGNSLPMAYVGDLVVPIDSILPVSISIDGEFVGHAMFGAFYDVNPVFLLPRGSHKFTFSCVGFKTTSAKLRVLGTGSKQYLVVKLQANTSDSDNATKPKSSVTTSSPSRG